MATRQKKYQEVNETFILTEYILEGDMTMVIKELQQFMDDHPSLYKFRMEQEASKWDSIIVRVHGTRLETNDERLERLAEARDVKERKKREAATDEADERARYETLKLKYES